MARKLLGSLMSMFERKKLSDNDIRIWAKTEYGKDWEYAYYSLQKTGQAPKTQTRSWFGFRTKGKK